MTGRKNLVAVGPESNNATGPAEPMDDLVLETGPDDDSAFDVQWLEDDAAPANSGWLAPAMAAAAVLAWTGFFAWVHQDTLRAGASPMQWSQWIVDWSVPVLLVVGIWLLAMRNSRKEATRFNDAAHALAQESALLERRLSTVNRELSLARDFIAAQSRDLESLGRMASDRLSQNAVELQTLIKGNGAEVEAIGRVSTTALDNMTRLRDDLPVISNSARDVANQIGQAGSVAHNQLDELVSGFNRLNEFGEASGRQVATLRGRIDEALTAFSGQAAQLEEIASARFAALAEQSAAFRTDLDTREIEAFAAIRRRADALRQELDTRSNDYGTAEEAALASLTERMNLLRDEGMRIADTLRTGESDAAAAWEMAITGLKDRMLEAIRHVADVDAKALESARSRLRTLAEEAERIDSSYAERDQTFHAMREARAAQASEHEAASLAAMQERLGSFDAQIAERQEEHLAHVAGLTERGEALAQRLSALTYELEQVEQRGQSTQEMLSTAAGTLAARLADSQQTIHKSSSELSRLTDESVRLLELIRSSAEHSSESLPQSLGEAERRLESFGSQVSALVTLVNEAENRSSALVGHVTTAHSQGEIALAQVSTLETRLSDLASASEVLADQARNELTGAIAELEQASGNVVESLRTQQSDAIRLLADEIGAESSKAIDEALRSRTADAIAELESAARQASESGRSTAVQLRDQLAAVNELAGNLERRVAHARQRAEEQVDNDFSRRMALITESLNSASIDITKAFATDVTDTAWASYLRGDRGIFTRRAVRLLNNNEVRAISDIYQEDTDFRETVNRYIHDFEAMLRSVLSTRDGHALAVTLLSSDMGKLYVALAQAIERLRS